MNSIVGFVALFVSLVFILSLMLGRTPGRIGRPPRGVGARRTDPSGTTLGLLLTAPPAGITLLSVTEPATAVTLGAMFGMAITVTARHRGLRSWVAVPLSVVGVLAAVMEAWAFVVSDTALDLTRTFRSALILLLLTCFVLGALVGGRAAALKGTRGLALFALIDVFVFMAGPAGSQLTDLAQTRFLLYLAVAGIAAAALGWAASELSLGLAAIAVTTTSLWLVLAGYDSSPTASGRIVAVVAALVAGTLLNRLLGLFTRL